MGFGLLEVGVILLLVMLLFGHRLPGVMRSMGRGVVEFKKGLQGIENDGDTLDAEPKEPRRS